MIVDTKCSKVSIVIPAYNTEQYIERCIESCLGQTYQNIEVVVVNDGSQDRTEQILNEYASKDSRLSIVNQANSGVSVARHKGVEYSTGEWIMFVDSDDYLQTDAVELLYDAVQNNNAQIASGVLFIVKKNKISGQYKNVLSHDANKETVATALLTEQVSGSLCGKIFQKELFKNVEMETGLKMGEDFLVCLQLFDQAEKIKTIDTFVYGYCHRPTSATFSGNKAVVESLLVFIEKTMNYYQSSPDFCEHSFRDVMDFFVMDRIVTYLTSGGCYASIGEELKVKLNKDCLKNKVACKKMKPHRLLILKLYSIFPFAGGFFKQGITIVSFLKKLS